MLGYTWTTCNGTCIFKQALIFIKTLIYLTLSGNDSKDLRTGSRLPNLDDLNLLRMSWRVAATRKYSCFRRSSLPEKNCQQQKNPHRPAQCTVQKLILNTIFAREELSTQYSGLHNTLKSCKRGSTFMKVRHFNSLRGRYIMVLLVHVMYKDVN